MMMKKSLLTILCVLLSTMSWAQGTTAGDSTAVAEPYAVLSENNTVLTFYYDENKTSRNGMSVEPVSGPYAIPWYDAHNTITNVVFEPAFGKCTTLTSTANWFYECTALTSISGIEYLNTTNVTDMHQMFTGCTSLTSLTLDGLNTSNVANMNSMFLSCSALTQLSININTENVTDMGYMFQYCGALTSLDLSSFNTAKVTEMEYIFYDCSQVTTIYVGSGWINNPDIHANDMFHGCSSLVGGNGTAFDSRYTSYAYAHIDGGTDNPGYFTDKNASYNEAYGVLVIDENNTASLTMYFDANRDAHREGQVIGLDEMMQNQAWMMYRENVTTVVFDSSFANCRPTSTAFWFAYCRSLTSIVGLQYLRTDETTNMSFMFNECSSLTSLDLSSLNTENVTNISGMLGGCRSLTSVDLSGFNTRQVTNMNSLFEQSAALTTINLSSFNTSQVTDMSYMFNECSALTTIYVGSDWSTEAVTNGTDMFNKCTNLVGGAGTTFSADHIDHTYARIDAEGTPGYLTDSKNASMTHFVMITVEGNGEVSAGQAAVIRDRGDVHVANGEPLEMFFFPDEGYQLASVKIDTLDVTSQVTPATEYSAASYTIPGVYGDIAITVTFAQTSTDAEAYAVLSDNNTILTFYYDDQKAGRGGMGVGPFEKSSNVGWYSVRRNIQTVVFDASFADCTSITSTTFWFNGFNSLDKIEGMENLKTDNVTNMSGMFAGCRVTNIDFSKLNTSNVTDMSMMFCEINGDLSASLDLSSFNTSKVTDMTEMFVESSGLSSINLSGFDTSNVTAMEDMFAECSALTSLDLSSFNTSNVANMGGLFRRCTALTTIYAGNEWSTDKVTDGSRMFYECTNLVGGAGTAYSADHTDHTYAHIDGGAEYPGYFTRSGEAHSGNAEPYAVLSENNTVLTFYYDSQKTARGGIDINSGYVSSDPYGNPTTAVFDASFANYTPTSTRSWFMRCSSLTAIIGIENLKTDNVTDMANMFSYCTSLTSLDVSGFNTANVTDMSYMFDNCRSLTSLDVSGFNTANVTNMASLFFECSGLTSIDLSNFNTSNVTSMSAMFVGCSGLTSLDLSGFSTANVTNMGRMFDNCSSLQNIYVGDGWSTAAVTESGSMFFYCIKLVGGAGTAYDENHVDVSYAHIDGGTANPGYFTDKNATPVTLSAPTIIVENNVLTMSTNTAGAAIYYTLDGSKPTKESASYTEPVTLKHNCYVRAFAAKEGSEDSEESTRDVGGLSINMKMAPPIIGYDYSNNITFNVPAIEYNGTDYTSKVAVEPASWGGVAPAVNLAGEWTCEILNDENTVTDTYTVTLKEDGKAVFPSPCLEESSTWSYGNNVLRMTHYKVLTQDGSYQYANYELTPTAPANPIEFTGDRTNTVGNWITESNSTAKVRFVYNGSSLSTETVVTSDGRETVMAVSNEGSSEKTGEVLQQTITGLENGYYTVELYAKSIYSSASPMADDVTFLFANDVNLFIPLEADRTIRDHNVYQIGVEVSDGTLRLGLSKVKTGANWHALQIRSLSSCTVNRNQSEQGANVYYRLNSRMLEGEETDFGSGSISGTKWSVTGGNATYRVAYGGYKDSYCLNLTSQKDSTYESAQAIYTFPTPLSKNTYYTLHFKGRSASGRGQMQISWQKDSLETTRSSVESMVVGSDLTNYELTFKIDSEGINKLIFNFGSVADTYYIDNVQFGAIISDTTNQHRTLYQGTLEVREGVMIKAVSQKQNMTPSAPEFIDYFYKGWSELRDIEAWSMETLHRAYGDPNVPLEMVEKTRAEVEYVVYDLFKRRENEHVDDTELIYRIREIEARVYEIRQMLEGFTVDGVSYHAVDSTQVEVVNSLRSYYSGTITIPTEVTYNGINFKVTSVAEGAFASTRLTAIRWYPAFALTNTDLQGANNPNMLIYVQSESQAPANRNNVIVNGVAKNVVLTDASGFGDFNCPETFTAEAIQYTRTFSQQTQIGVSRGWEAIALPFTVQTYTHADRGVIAPFGNSASENHFWLRELTQNGLQNAQTIEANKPYIISMPNSEEYRPETNLAGQVTFSALNAIVPVTEATPVEYGSISLVPAFQSRSAQTEIYALNVGEERNGYPEGSVFERDYRTVRPFEAYTLHRDNQNPAPQFIMIGGDMGNGTTGIEELVDKRMNTNDSWYTIDGRKLQGAPTSKGLYIRNGKKVIVR